MDEHKSIPMDTRSAQKRLEALWEVLEVPAEDRFAMAIKYGHLEADGVHAAPIKISQVGRLLKCGKMIPCCKDSNLFSKCNSNVTGDTRLGGCCSPHHSKGTLAG
jgi:hypothetical protein